MIRYANQNEITTRWQAVVSHGTGVIGVTLGVLWIGVGSLLLAMIGYGLVTVILSQVFAPVASVIVAVVAIVWLSGHLGPETTRIEILPNHLCIWQLRFGRKTVEKRVLRSQIAKVYTEVTTQPRRSFTGLPSNS